MRRALAALARTFGLCCDALAVAALLACLTLTTLNTTSQIGLPISEMRLFSNN
ncbi:MAG: hypothetical protein KF780_06090 [Sphingomonas sp.]|nr:hypothetical protein [Sphingomonas sp.]